jgi:hypothetical protein
VTCRHAAIAASLCRGRKPIERPARPLRQGQSHSDERGTTGRRAFGRGTSGTERGSRDARQVAGGLESANASPLRDVPPAGETQEAARQLANREGTSYSGARPTASWANLHLRSPECLADRGSVDSESLADRGQ